MISFEYVIKEPVGIHARPAGMLNKEARKYKSAIVVHRGDKSANVLRLMALMQLGVKCGETVKVTIEGEDPKEDICLARRVNFTCSGVALVSSCTSRANSPKRVLSPTTFTSI